MVREKGEAKKGGVEGRREGGREGEGTRRPRADADGGPPAQDLPLEMSPGHSHFPESLGARGGLGSPTHARLRGLTDQ